MAEPSTSAVADDYDELYGPSTPNGQLDNDSLQHAATDEAPEAAKQIDAGTVDASQPADDIDALYDQGKHSGTLIAKSAVVDDATTSAPTISSGNQTTDPRPAAILGDAPASATHATLGISTDDGLSHVSATARQPTIANATARTAEPQVNDTSEAHTTATMTQEDVQPLDGNTQDVQHHEAPSQEETGVPAEAVAAKQPQDPEFLAAAEANKDDKEAEWQYDSSDMEMSSSDSDSDSSSSDEADDDYEMMDPAEAVKMLMAEEGGDDDDGDGKVVGTKSAIRSKNEQPEVVVPKPDVEVTSSMRIVPLGKVETIVESFVLVKATTSGEYQVLEQGSVLCLEDRSVIGAIAETFGRVQEPLYSIAFTNRKEVEDAKVTVGTLVYYVEEHSTFVFTEPLKGLKGTDASNIHDEEVGADEIEFSDDEAEAAYKRMVKQARRGGKGAAGADRGGRPAQPTSYEAENFDRKIISYDDDGDDMYTPLTRPADYTNMTSGNAPSETRTRNATFDRGRGRGGRGRGRGDRGGGRGGRAGYQNNDSTQRRGPSNSFPDQHNHHGQAPPTQAPHSSMAPGMLGPQWPYQPPNPYQQIQTPNGWPIPPGHGAPPPPPPGWAQSQFLNQQAQVNPSWMQSLQQPHHLQQHEGTPAAPTPAAPQAYGQPQYAGHQYQWPGQAGMMQQGSQQDPNAAYHAALQHAEMLRQQLQGGGQR